MRRLSCTLLALSLGITAPFVHAATHTASVPAALLRPLPDRAAAIAAIEAQPSVARARAEKAAANARAGGQQRGPHDWIAGGQWQQRDAGDGQRLGEWELSLERAVRLPGKARLDRHMAGLERDAGADILADARHVAATELLQAWIDWLAADELAAQAQAAAAIAGEDLQGTLRRLQAGHASAAEHDAAVAADATARRLLQQAHMDAEEAQLALSLRYPQLALPASAPRIDAPEYEAIDWEAWATRVVAVSHDITRAENRATLADRRAERARLERRADPSVGIRTLSERGGEESAIGVFVSIPLGAGSRRAVAEEQAAMAAAYHADATATRLQTQLQARTLARRVTLQGNAWRLARDAAQAQAREASRMARGHALEGVDLADLLAARKRANDAGMAEIQARSAAFASSANLLLHAHAYWLDDHQQPATAVPHCHRSAPDPC